MLPLLYVVVPLILSFLAYKLLLNPAYSSSLSKLPVPHWSCHISGKWFDRQCLITGELKTLYAAHQRLGVIVRLGPKEVSVVSQEGLKKIYTDGLDKSEWYDRTFRVYGVPNLVCTLNHKTHATIRRMIAGLYTKSYVQHSAGLDELSRRIVLDRLLPSLVRSEKEPGAIEVMRLFECVGVDFITGYVFGAAVGTDFLGDIATRDGYFGEWDRLRESPHQTVKPFTESLFMEMCRAAIITQATTDTSPAKQMYTHMSDKAKAWNMTDQEVITRCASEMVDHIIATQETATITWVYILYRLSQHPRLQARLRTELATLTPGFEQVAGERTLPTPASIEKLPLLNSIVLETLRLHAANPARMRRVVSSAGLILHGVAIPPSTIVSTNAYCLHRNEDIFPQPFDWLPERWLLADGHTGAETDVLDINASRRWFWAFGSGTRNCIGQHFALQVIKLVVAAIYSQYATTIVDDSGIEQSDSYNSGPIGRQLTLRFDAMIDNIR